MSERPILFNESMVRAILDGRKTQTRRVMKQAHFLGCDWADAVYPARDSGWIAWTGRVAPGPELAAFTKEVYATGFACPYGAIGDRLWVRETFAIVPRTAYAASDGVQQTPRPDDDHDAAIYATGWERSTPGTRWRPSIHMPRWASRITLEITGVRVERVQDISEADAKREGAPCGWYERDTLDGPEAVPTTHIAGFRSLWNSISARIGYAWEGNPWVWVIDFRKVQP